MVDRFLILLLKSENDVSRLRFQWSLRGIRSAQV